MENIEIFTIIKKWVIRAVNTHFSDVLEIKKFTDNSNSDNIIYIMIKNFKTSNEITINYFPNSNPDKRETTVQTRYSVERFVNYNQLKKAIRNALLSIRMSEQVINETDINNNYKMNNNISDEFINNETITPKDNSLIRFVKKAVYKHFSDVLYINTIIRNTKGSFISINCIDNIGYSRYLKIYYKGYVNYPNFKFSNYGELKKAIRNALLNIRIRNISNLNVENNYKMLKNNLSLSDNKECPRDIFIIRYLEKAIHTHFINVLDIQNLKNISNFEGKFIKIKFKYNKYAFLKIYYFNREIFYINKEHNPKKFNYINYGELKIAIRNAILEYARDINASLTNNIDKKMLVIVNDNTPTPKNRELLQFINKALIDVDPNDVLFKYGLGIRRTKNSNYIYIYTKKDKTFLYFYYDNLPESYMYYNGKKIYFSNYGELKGAIIQFIGNVN